MVTSPIKTYDIVVNVDGYMDGTIDDWPQNIQDGIFEALERLSDKIEHPVTIINSKCDFEPNDEEGGEDTFYVHVIASEVVMGDERTIHREQSEFNDIMDKHLQDRRLH